ncbi:hypothetical protein [Aquibacillus salsiterrae]|uniref:Uncharacterized protein n=1 Tax=Aquibacillus salsiterrae TaxID=2950439 RepID=A0A9X3WHX0_9BACI|nr:hypothetical protein [Aquibacillus salsiterrae]MDC3418716.1 hypothetical protein [Aquibacillus salsiterrae]
MTIEIIEAIFQTNLSSYKKSVTELSKDSANDEELCNSDKEYIDYDQVIEDLYMSEDVLPTPDLVTIKDNKVIYVEFKNGKIDNKEKKKLKFKGIEGGFIALYDITSKYHAEITFNEIQLIEKEYYVVYNSNKNSQSRVGKMKAHLEGQQIRFGLKKYQGTFFSKIETMSNDRFIEKIEEIL